MAKRQVFISYHHHGAQNAVDNFRTQFSDNLEVFTDSSIEREADSDDVSYLTRVCREAITGTSVTIVVISRQTGRRKFVDWEIHDTLDKKHGLLAISVPGLSASDASLPDRLTDNLKSGTGYAKWYDYPSSGSRLLEMIEAAYNADVSKINNTRPKRTNNS